MWGRDGRKFNKGTYHEDPGEARCPDHGIGISGDALQHYGYGMDRSSGIKGSSGSRRRGNVYRKR